MTFAQSNMAVGNTIKFLAGLLPVLAAGLVFGLVIGVPFAFLSGNGEALTFCAAVGMAIAFFVFASELDKAGKLP